MFKINSLFHEQNCYYIPEWIKKQNPIITHFKLLIL